MAKNSKNNLSPFKDQETPTPPPSPEPTVYPTPPFEDENEGDTYAGENTTAPGTEQQNSEDTEETAVPETDEGETDQVSDQESSEYEAIPTAEIPDNPLPQDDGPGFGTGLLIGALAGAVIATGIVFLLKKLFRGRHKGGSIEAVSVQGLGARENQQDALYFSDPALYDTQGILLCVADGMGGLSNGAIISSTAVSAVSNTFVKANKSDPERLLLQLAQAATSAVNTILAPNYGAGGTTLLLGYLRQGMFWYCSVGDSRICLCRDGELVHLNRRHVFEDELLLTYVNGDLTYERAKNYEKRGALTSYLGMGHLKYLDLPDSYVQTKKGDRIILMSDGVFNTLEDRELVSLLEGKTESLSDKLTKEVEQKAKKGQDNYSAVVVEIC